MSGISCGSILPWCDVPIAYDNFVGCSHGCKYCFINDKYDITRTPVSPLFNQKELARFIAGERTSITNWCDWKIPLHWGTLSDPFQPAEIAARTSLESLRLFAKSKHPVIISTKGTAVLVTSEYLELLKECNALVQVSMLSAQYDAAEPGATPFGDRLAHLPALADNCKRLIVRWQPYTPEVKADCLAVLPTLKAASVYGVIFEGLKSRLKRPGMMKIGKTYYLDNETVIRDFRQLKAAVNSAGMKFYSGEERTRLWGDSVSCCGFDGLDGFVGNRCNLNHLLMEIKHGGKHIDITPAQRNVGSANVFRALRQRTAGKQYFKSISFADAMQKIFDVFPSPKKVDGQN